VADTSIRDRRRAIQEITARGGPQIAFSSESPFFQIVQRAGKGELPGPLDPVPEIKPPKPTNESSDPQPEDGGEDPAEGGFEGTRSIGFRRSLLGGNRVSRRRRPPLGGARRSSLLGLG
jgi:hypothetical protein